jgi:predicted nucleotidyltransferase
MDRDEILEESLRIIHRHLPRGEFKVYLFGSWAKGLADPASDIDLAILGPQPVDDRLWLRLKEEMGSIPTLRRIDVVDLNETDESFRTEVLSYARVL